ncbi:Eukaryotic aspartyl protease family protein [Perilla frutescens var. hirtella]|uniref:Eukaryotic aspartyl protease family protein n=1 Tax=Perilla frutescens var. hirtella TaxID=608512 RepID=A0AAD4JCD3_PERFH|nr:Eukaryotic aspartyl protease family protein [Perilla frutescens var. frutescens]KAH6830583.1 Eukaryotic aspartyl protease family protein [Perilla frutescens var. hirtella]
MEIRLPLLPLLLIVCVQAGLGEPIVYSARLVHRFSDEAKAHRDFRVFRNGAAVGAGAGGGFWPQRRSLEYYRRLLSSDVERQTLKLNPQFQFLYPSEGSATLPLGNDFGWLHYMWIDIGTPKVSFLVALDAGSDLFWVPCDCVQCAPLSSSYYSSLDKDLNEYIPSASSTSKTISCSHQLCEQGPNCPNPKQQCPYTINYYSDDTSTSGFLVEDVLHLLAGQSDVSNKSVKAPVIIGCGSKQTGGYLSGVAPDGLLGLGLGEISVASLLAKAGYIRNSFSLCFNEDDSGRLLFGDQGIADQQTTPFLPLDGKNLTYIVGVDACCIESSCLDNTNFQMLVDSGSSFTYLPEQIFEKVADDFDRQVNASKSTFEGYPWQYCYKSSSNGVPKLPSFTLKFATSKSFVVNNPVFVIYGTQGAVGFCLAVQPTDGDIGTIGQNFMTGYQIVFDREKFKLGWSRSNCKDLDYGDRAPLNPSGNNSSPNSLPTTAQQSAPNSHAIAPAVAGRTPSKSSATCISCLAKLFLLLLMAHFSST